jgi:hypothetical protein
MFFELSVGQVAGKPEDIAFAVGPAGTALDVVVVVVDVVDVVVVAVVVVDVVVAAVVVVDVVVVDVVVVNVVDVDENAACKVSTSTSPSALGPPLPIYPQ